MGWTIYWVVFGDFIFILAWECNHVILLSLSSMVPAALNNSRMFALASRAELSDQQVKSQKRVFWEASCSAQWNGAFKTKIDNRNKTHCTSTFPYLTHHKSSGAVLTSLITMLLTLYRRLSPTTRETTEFRHYHYHPWSKSVCWLAWCRR